MLAYHGTNAEFERFDETKSANGLIFFALEKGFAIDWLTDHRHGECQRIITAEVTALNPWDYQNTDHVNLLLDALRDQGTTAADTMEFEENIYDGDWASIERTEGLVQTLKNFGFDGIFMTEGSDMDRNIAVFNATQVRIVGQETLAQVTALLEAELGHSAGVELAAVCLSLHYNATSAVGPHEGVIKAVNENEVFQHVGQGRHVVWDRVALSGCLPVVGKNMMISKDGVVKVSIDSPSLGI